MWNLRLSLIRWKLLLPYEDDDDRMIAVDMSSNFLSRPVDVRKYAVVFGGAQKNVGVTGITIVIVKKSLLSDYPDAKFLQQLGLSGLPGPIMLDYPTIAKNNSLYNTLPIFNLYIATRVMQTLVQQFDGRIAGQQELADKKAHMLYGVLDAHTDVYQVVPDKSVRSRMNICFRIKGGDEAAEKEFIKGAEAKGLMGLKGHRSVGGIRASNYNAVSMEMLRSCVRGWRSSPRGRSSFTDYESTCCRYRTALIDAGDIVRFSTLPCNNFNICQVDIRYG